MKFKTIKEHEIFFKNVNLLIEMNYAKIADLLFSLPEIINNQKIVSYAEKNAGKSFNTQKSLIFTFFQAMKIYHDKKNFGIHDEWLKELYKIYLHIANHNREITLDEALENQAEIIDKRNIKIIFCIQKLLKNNGIEDLIKIITSFNIGISYISDNVEYYRKAENLKKIINDPELNNQFFNKDDLNLLMVSDKNEETIQIDIHSLNTLISAAFDYQKTISELETKIKKLESGININRNDENLREHNKELHEKLEYTRNLINELTSIVAESPK